jgi:putative aminopeptidase FrvX
MTDILPFLKSLLSIPGISGFEMPAADLIKKEWGPLADELSLSRLGSLHALKKGSGLPPRPSIMLACHMDAIGMMVSKIEKGFLRITYIGGIDPRVLPSQAVTVHAKDGDLPGVIVMPPATHLPEETGKGFLHIRHLFVDVGLSPSKVENLVRIGDLVSFGIEPFEMSGDTLCGHSVDNRASVAAVTVCLQELQSKAHTWDVFAVATVQEEMAYIGAVSSAFELKPDLGIAIDVTFGKGPGANDWQSFALGEGPTLGYGPNIHPFLHKKFKELAEQLEIPFSIEYLPHSSGTDGMAIQVTAGGIPVFVLGIPTRNMHTPVEMVALKDIRRAGRLLAEFVAGLEADFMQTITWDED